MSTSEARRITLELVAGTFVALDYGDASAPVVLCIHGFPDHARSFEQIAPLLVKAGYRCVAPWLRGYAPSVLEGPYDLDRIASDILAIARAVSPNRPVVLVGHDWGAAASYLALAREPGLFSHAVTIAVPHPLALMRNVKRYPKQLQLSWYMGFFQLRGLADVVLKRDKLAFIDQLWRTWSPSYTPPLEYMRDLKRCLSASLPAPLGYYRALLSPRPSSIAKLKAELKQTRAIQVPTLYLHGEEDGCMLYAVSEGQTRYFTHGFESRCLPGVGHFLHLEAPDTTTAHITRFAQR